MGDGLWEEEERALKPLVPAGVTVCDETGAGGFWATSVPAAQKSEQTGDLRNLHPTQSKYFLF